MLRVWHDTCRMYTHVDSTQKFPSTLFQQMLSSSLTHPSAIHIVSKHTSSIIDHNPPPTIFFFPVQPQIIHLKSKYLQITIFHSSSSLSELSAIPPWVHHCRTATQRSIFAFPSNNCRKDAHAVLCVVLVAGEFIFVTCVQVAVVWLRRQAFGWGSFADGGAPVTLDVAALQLLRAFTDHLLIAVLHKQCCLLHVVQQSWNSTPPCCPSSQFLLET